MELANYLFFSAVNYQRFGWYILPDQEFVGLTYTNTFCELVQLANSQLVLVNADRKVSEGGNKFTNWTKTT